MDSMLYLRYSTLDPMPSNMVVHHTGPYIEIRYNHFSRIHYIKVLRYCIYLFHIHTINHLSGDALVRCLHPCQLWWHWIVKFESLVKFQMVRERIIMIESRTITAVSILCTDNFIPISIHYIAIGFNEVMKSRLLETSTFAVSLILLLLVSHEYIPVISRLDDCWWFVLFLSSVYHRVVVASSL